MHSPITGPVSSQADTSTIHNTPTRSSTLRPTILFRYHDRKGRGKRLVTARRAGDTLRVRLCTAGRDRHAGHRHRLLCHSGSMGDHQPADGSVPRARPLRQSRAIAPTWNGGASTSNTTSAMEISRLASKKCRAARTARTRYTLSTEDGLRCAPSGTSPATVVRAAHCEAGGGESVVSLAGRYSQPVSPLAAPSMS